MDFEKFMKIALESDSKIGDNAKYKAKKRLLEAFRNGEKEDLKTLIQSYRINDSQSKQDQRVRLTANPCKSIIGAVENVLNQLTLMSTPGTKVFSDKDNASNEENAQVKDVETFIYENDLENLAFESVRNASLSDANKFMIARINDFEDLVFQVEEFESVRYMYENNGKMKALLLSKKIIKDEKEIETFEYFSETEYAKGTINIKDKTFYVEERFSQELIHAIRLGYIVNSKNRMMRDSLLEKTSELLISLAQKQSDFDVEMALHGIVEKKRYAPKCNFSNNTPTEAVKCVQGELVNANGHTGVKCGSCNGTGFKQANTQDIEIYPLPPDMKDIVDLSKLSSTVFMPSESLQFKADYIKALKDEILETVFNRSVITKSEVQKTATEVSIDLQGVYATLTGLGLHVSNVFIWMVEVYIAYKGYKGLSVIHGYVMSLKLETIESLVALRERLVTAQAPMWIIKTVDLAILAKQNSDNPDFITQFSTWEKYKPFSDKTESMIGIIISGLGKKDLQRIKYVYWNDIKNAILDTYGDKFYEFSPEKKIEEINREAQKIADTFVTTDNEIPLT